MLRTRKDAVAHALRMAGMTTDPEALIAAAAARGDEIPGLSFWPSINGQPLPSWTFDGAKIAELKKLVASLQADATKSTRKAEKGTTHEAR